MGPVVDALYALLSSRLSKVAQPVGQKRALGKRKFGNFDAFGWHNHCENVSEVRALFFEARLCKCACHLICGWRFR